MEFDVSNVDEPGVLYGAVPSHSVLLGCEGDKMKQMKAKDITHNNSKHVNATGTCTCCHWVIQKSFVL